MKASVLCTAAIICNLWGQAQQKHYLSLGEVIAIAQSRSPKAKQTTTEKEISTFQFQSFKSDMKPLISLYGNAPVYDKEYYGVRQPDGSILFQSISQSNINAGLGISQHLGFSGGDLSLNTEFTRFDDYQGHIRQYSGTPVFMKLVQPIFAVNDVKWRKKIEPLKLEEANRNFSEEMEDIAQQATVLYFNVVDVQINMSIALANLRNMEDNYEIEKKRVLLGTTTEDKLLQLELQVLRSNQDLEKARYDYQISELSFKNYIGDDDPNDLELSIPDKIPFLTVSLSKAIDYARKNRAAFISFTRKTLEGQRDIAQAKADRQQVNLSASFGLNNAANNFTNIYQNLNNQQMFSIGFNIPIVDWGRSRAKYNIALSMAKLTRESNEFEQIKLLQEITTLVKNMDLLQSNITLAQKTDSVAMRRFEIANRLYQVGKLSVTDLNLAQSEKDFSRRSYISSLRDYWNGYYMLRKLTLFDFEKQQALIKD